MKQFKPLARSNYPRNPQRHRTKSVFVSQRVLSSYTYTQNCARGPWVRSTCAARSGMNRGLSTSPKTKNSGMCPSEHKSFTKQQLLQLGTIPKNFKLSTLLTRDAGPSNLPDMLGYKWAVTTLVIAFELHDPDRAKIELPRFTFIPICNITHTIFPFFYVLFASIPHHHVVPDKQTDSCLEPVAVINFENLLH